MKSALILIDVQESFRHRPFFSTEYLQDYLNAQNALIKGCVARDIPIVRVFHVAGEKDPSNPFSYESGHIRPLQGLVDFEAAHHIQKSRHSALVGTGLIEWLELKSIQRLIISGLRTEQCCETTARHASDLRWEVDFATEATLTFDMQNSDGSILSAADIKTRTSTVLAGRFARICTVDQALG